MILGNEGQVRASAWSLRQIDGAGWIMPDDDPDVSIFREAVSANWAWLRSKIPAWTALQGEAHGWLPGGYGDGLVLAPWQQDYMASTVGQAARRGNADARTFLAWMSNFLVGRFRAEDKGFAFSDGAAYNMAIRARPGYGEPFRSWAEIARAMLERNLSAPAGWAPGNYAALALMSLAQIADVLDMPEAWQSYARVVAARPPHASPESLSGMPSVNIVPRGTQRFPDRLRACTAAAPAQR